MKLSYQLIIPSLILASSLSFASEGGGGGQGEADLSNLPKYLLNLGSYLGYDLQTAPPDQKKEGPSQNLLSVNTLQLLQNYTFSSYLGSTIVNSIPSIAQIVSSGLSQSVYPSFLNPFANYSFNPSGGAQRPSYLNPNQEGGVSVSQLIDQPPYQADPVSQSVFNLIGTPDYSYCMDNDEKNLKPCQYSPSPNDKINTINEYQVMANVLGAPTMNDSLPGLYDYFNFNKNQSILGDLNVNSLISPLLYNTTGNLQTSGTNESNPGLLSRSQAQQAANFIRYATGAVSPIPMVDAQAYSSKIALLAPGSTASDVAKAQAKASLVSYLTSLRVYAAQASVGISNLYYIMSKRLQQNQGQTQQTSQALSEFTMATWRLFDPNQQGENATKTQWIQKINTATSATVQKEMAILLAEINYQLYLNRQQDERLLLTNSLLLLQGSKNNRPDPQLLPPSTGNRGTQTSL